MKYALLLTFGLLLTGCGVARGAADTGAGVASGAAQTGAGARGYRASLNVKRAPIDG